MESSSFYFVVILTISSGNTLVPHDRNGRMTKIPQPNSWSSAYTLVYDAWNRLISVSDGDTLVATYMYDARNHRIKTTVGTTVTLKYFNRNWQEVESVAAGVTTTYVYGLRYIDDIVCRMKNTEVLYSLQDPNWNVVALVTPSSTVAERLTYDSFGRVTFRNSDFTTKVSSSYGWAKTFTGQVYDTETGLMLYRNRYYHPTLGRFITRDPIGYEGDRVNFYRYTENDGVNTVDPLGYIRITCTCATNIPVYSGVGGPPTRYTNHTINCNGDSPRKCCDKICKKPYGYTSDYRISEGAVERCCRPTEVNCVVDNLSKIGPKHCWIRTTRKEAGVGNPEETGSCPKYGPIEIVDHAGQGASRPGAVCTQIPGCIESCVSNELQYGKDMGVWTIFNNCNTFVTSVLRKCGCVF